MEITKGCVYWYEVYMHVDINGYGYRVSTPVRIPVVCIDAGLYSSTCQYLSPSSGVVETRYIQNQYLFENPIAGTK